MVIVQIFYFVFTGNNSLEVLSPLGPKKWRLSALAEDEKTQLIQIYYLP